MLFILKYIVLLVVIIGSYIDWKKYNDKDFFWCFLLGIFGLLLALWSNFADKIFHFSDTTNVISNVIILILAIMTVLLGIIEGIIIMKKRCVKQGK